MCCGDYIVVKVKCCLYSFDVSVLMYQLGRFSVFINFVLC